MTTTNAPATHHLVACPGVPHSNPFIDHCGTCAPRWGWVCVPADCADVDAYYAKLDDAWLRDPIEHGKILRENSRADMAMRRAERAAKRAIDLAR